LDSDAERIRQASEIPISKLEKSQLYIVFVILAIGLVIDLFATKNLLAFQRSGAVVVCVGIFIGSKLYARITAFHEELYNAIVIGKEKLHRSYISATGQIALPTTDIPNAEEVYDKSAIVLSESLKKTKNRIVNLEVWVLVLGTLVWSFGDITKLIRKTTAIFCGC